MTFYQLCFGCLSSVLRRISFHGHYGHFKSWKATRWPQIWESCSQLTLRLLFFHRHCRLTNSSLGRTACGNANLLKLLCNLWLIRSIVASKFIHFIYVLSAFPFTMCCYCARLRTITCQSVILGSITIQWWSCGPAVKLSNVPNSKLVRPADVQLHAHPGQAANSETYKKMGGKQWLRCWRRDSRLESSLILGSEFGCFSFCDSIEFKRSCHLMVLGQTSTLSSSWMLMLSARTDLAAVGS